MNNFDIKYNTNVFKFVEVFIMVRKRFDVRVPISLSDQMHNELTELSAQTGATMSAIVREAIASLIKNVRKRQASAVTTSSA